MTKIIKEGQKIKHRNKMILLTEAPYHSHLKGVYICDFCGSEFERTIRERNYTFERSPYDSCSRKDCTKKKREKSNIIKFGTKTPAESDEIKEKMINTFRKNYGVDNPMFVDDIVHKIAETKSKNGTDVLWWLTQNQWSICIVSTDKFIKKNKWESKLFIRGEIC